VDSKGVKSFVEKINRRCDSGQAVVMDPPTGKISDDGSVKGESGKLVNGIGKVKVNYRNDDAPMAKPRPTLTIELAEGGAPGTAAGVIAPKNADWQKNLLYYITEYCEIILESNLSLKMFADECRNYTKLIPRFFYPLVKSKSFKLKFRDILLKTLSSQTQGEGNFAKSNHEIIMQTLNRRLRRLKIQLKNILKFLVDNAHAAHPTKYLGSVKWIALTFVDLLQIKFLSFADSKKPENTKGDIEPYLTNISELKEILERRESEILAAFHKRQRFSGVLTSIKQELLQKISTHESLPKKFFRKIKLFQFYKSLIETTNKKFPQYRDTCEYLSKKTPYFFKKFLTVKGVHQILRSEVLHSYTMTQSINLSHNSANFSKVFQELLIEQLKDFVKDFEKGFQLIKRQFSLPKISGTKNAKIFRGNQNFLRAILLAIYQKIKNCKHFTVDSLVSGLQEFDLTGIDYRNKPLFNLFVGKVIAQINLLSQGDQQEGSVSQRPKGTLAGRMLRMRTKKLGKKDDSKKANKIIQNLNNFDQYFVKHFQEQVLRILKSTKAKAPEGEKISVHDNNKIWGKTDSLISGLESSQIETDARRKLIEIQSMATHPQGAPKSEFAIENVYH
jgi:hypothetical protein